MDEITTVTHQMKIVEIFVSRQGEGVWTGTLSTFIRRGGCNLFCSYCDTRYASWESEPGENISPEEITERAILYRVNHVVITGGEPMADPEIVPLSRLLSEQNFIVTIETNGTYDLPVCCALMSISPKMKNSVPSDPRFRYCHEQRRYRPDVVRELLKRYPSQLKFVVDTPDDLEEIDQYLREIGPFDRRNILLMPQSVDLEQMRRKEKWLCHICQSHGFTYAPRMQLEWYGGQRGK
jgi:7-carboxy-7-deazaguanine synthase